VFLTGRCQTGSQGDNGKSGRLKNRTLNRNGFFPHNDLTEKEKRGRRVERERVIKRDRKEGTGSLLTGYYGGEREGEPSLNT